MPIPFKNELRCIIAPISAVSLCMILAESTTSSPRVTTMHVTIASSLLLAIISLVQATVSGVQPPATLGDVDPWIICFSYPPPANAGWPGGRFPNSYATNFEVRTIRDEVDWKPS